ncbi:L,D-transpeptidase [Candidatus Albibeggiatoa sp. nov. NOAA]|uniref:L,D-transpeptidase n=1 Tax=Candidatus Albibeggiatoa sp. nov. NOAA TaxID=3162724 RepID=UPI003302CACE|nr:L,D-transpeptidase [Thiotrichaceae bacterium]
MPDTPYIEVNIHSQHLTLWDGQTAIFERAVSTAKNGVGELQNTGCTPRGWLQIKAKIGADHPKHSVFVGRRATGEIYSADLNKQYPQRDWILSRILWLGGLEPHKNRYGSVDTLRRFIYIHGCPDHCPMGVPESHGCIRMRNDDVIQLFNLVNVGTKVHVVG